MFIKAEILENMPLSGTTHLVDDVAVGNGLRKMVFRHDGDLYMASYRVLNEVTGAKDFSIEVVIGDDAPRIVEVFRCEKRWSVKYD